MKQLWQELMVGFGCDTIPALPYNHNTLIWVGLNWKVIYFSMGVFLHVLARWSWGCLRPWMYYPNTYAVPRMTGFDITGRSRSWAEVPILGCVIERLWLIIRILSMIIQVLPWRMYRMLWWKCTPSAEDRNYSNSRVHGQGRLDGHTVPLSVLVKIKLCMKLNQLNCGKEVKDISSYLSNLDN